jgi:hypothetical protein
MTNIDELEDYLSRENGLHKSMRYVIIVASEDDKKKLESAFEHIHYSDIDTNIDEVNSLAHQYLTPERTGDAGTRNSILVSPDLLEAAWKDLGKE